MDDKKKVLIKATPREVTFEELKHAVRDIVYMFQFFQANPNYKMHDYLKRPEFKGTAIYKLLTELDD